MGWLLEGSSLCLFAPQNAPVKAFPRSKLSPEATVTPVRTRVLEIPRCRLCKAARARRFRRVIFVRKASVVPAACPPPGGSWVPEIPWRRECPPVSPGWEGTAAHPTPSRSPFPWEYQSCKPKQGQIQHLFPTGHLCPSSPVGKCQERHLDSTMVTITCPTSGVPAPPPSHLFLPWLRLWVTLMRPHPPPPSALGTLFLPSHGEMTHPKNWLQGRAWGPRRPPGPVGA